jgi:hypothetical protein
MQIVNSRERVVIRETCIFKNGTRRFFEYIGKVSVLTRNMWSREVKIDHYS